MIEICLGKSQVKCLTIGDPHFKVSNIEEMKEWSSRVINVAKEVKPDFIVNLGDTLDTHEKIHVVPLVDSIEFMRELSLIAPLFVVIGNHDRMNNSDFLSKYHPFSAMKYWNNTYIVDTPIEAVIGTFRMIFCPYVFPGRFMEALENIESYHISTACIFAHQELYGTHMVAIKTEKGDKWPLNYPLVATGHIHDYSRPQTNIINVGCSKQHAFGDHTDKTLSIFNFTKDENDQFIPVEGIGYTEERVGLGMKMRKIIYLNVDDVLDYNPPTDYILKIVIRGLTSDLNAIMKHHIVKSWISDGIVVVPKATLEEKNITDAHVENIKYASYSFELQDHIKEDPLQTHQYQKLFFTGVSGTLVNSSGTLVNSSGTLVNSSGTLVNSSGTLVNSSGTLVNSTKNNKNSMFRIVN